MPDCLKSIEYSLFVKLGMPVTHNQNFQTYPQYGWTPQSRLNPLIKFP